MNDGKTVLVGLLGWPVSHSLSPAMHNAAFRALDLNWCYVPLPVRPAEPDSIRRAVYGLAALGFRGANVTVPHKRAVIAALDEVTPAAAALGAVNTLVIDHTEGSPARVTGHNTDSEGFLRSLGDAGCEPPVGGTAVVVGAGGAARAVVHGLLRAGLSCITVLNRTLSSAQALVADLGPLASQAVRFEAIPLAGAALVEVVGAADLLVNATTVGMGPGEEDSIWPDGAKMPAGLAVVDLVYHPLETRLLRQARRAGAHPVDGLGMLVQQGALAFRIWTGAPAPLDVMRAACAGALGRRPCCDS